MENVAASPMNSSPVIDEGGVDEDEMVQEDDNDDGDEGPSSSQLDKIPLSSTIGSLSQSEKGFRTNDDDDEEDGDDGGDDNSMNSSDQDEEAEKNLPNLVVDPYGHPSGRVEADVLDGTASHRRSSDPFTPLDYSGPATAEDTEPARPEEVYGLAVEVAASKGKRFPESGVEAAAAGDDENMAEDVEEADDAGSLGSDASDIGSVPSGGSSGLSGDENDSDDDSLSSSRQRAGAASAEDSDDLNVAGAGVKSVHSTDAEKNDIDRDFDEDDDFMASSLVRLSGDQKHQAMRERKRTVVEAGMLSGSNVGSGSDESHNRSSDDDSADRPPPARQIIMRGGGRGGLSKFEAMKRKRVALETSHSNEQEDDTSDDSDAPSSPEKQREASREASKLDALRRLARGGGKGRSDTKKLRFSDESGGLERSGRNTVTVTVLGSAQDGGLPQPGCYGSCCEWARNDPLRRRMPVALGITGKDGSKHLVEASRCLGEQIDLWKSCGTYALQSSGGAEDDTERTCPVDSVCITHAHLGHVDGLGLFGREVIGAKNLPLHCSTSFKKEGIDGNPLWSAMVEQGCIVPKVWDKEIAGFVPGSGEAVGGGDDDEDMPEAATEVGFVVHPLPVPHRAELSDTHAFLFEGVPSGRRLLFLPDQDNWDETLEAVGCSSVREWLVDKLDVDIALLDGTFFNPQAELGNVRNIDEIPHPPVAETLVKLGKKQKGEDKDRRFIFCHLNHTNPLCNPNSTERKLVEESGWEVASEGDLFEL